MTLEEIGKKYSTDKMDHGFLPFYEKVLNPFRTNARRVLEIGIDKGCSLYMWAEYFPQAIIEGWDLKEFNPGTFGDGVATFVVNQSNRDSMQSCLTNLGISPGRGYDIIIDDGSHRMWDQQITLGFLWKVLNPGGIFIVEDLHTSLPHNPCEWAGGGCFNDFSNSTLEALKRLRDSHCMYSQYMLGSEMSSIGMESASCEVIDVLGDGRHITSVITKIDSRINIQSIASE